MSNVGVPFSDIPEVEFSAAKGAVVRHFSELWLTSEAISEVQTLWQTDDPSASLELFWLGTALLQLEVVDAAWIQSQVVLAKSKDANNRRGAIFEILALAMLCGSAGRVFPAPRNNAAYDGHIEFDGGSRALISLKNFGHSRHAREAQRQGEMVVEAIRKAAQQVGIHWVGLTILATTFPRPEDWLRLREYLRDNVALGGTSVLLGAAIDPWQILWTVAPPDLCRQCVSNQVTIAAPYYQHELLTYTTKLDEACAKARKSLGAAEAASAILFARIAESLYLPDLNEWALKYFAENPSGPIDEVFFFQPALVINEHTALHHHITRFGREGLERPPIHLTVPAGVTSTAPTYLALQWEGQAPLPLMNHYLFQSGDHYRRISAVGDLAAEGSFGVTGPNVRTHIVIEDGSSTPLILSSRSSGSAELRLLP